MESAADANRVFLAWRVGDLRGEADARLTGDFRGDAIVAETDTALGEFLGDLPRDGVELFRVRMVVGRGGMPLEGQDSSCNDQSVVPKFQLPSFPESKWLKKDSTCQNLVGWSLVGWSLDNRFSTDFRQFLTHF